MDVSCPRCHSNQTTKASAIVHSGNTMATTHGIGGGVTIGPRGLAPTVVNYHSTTHMTSTLASKLAPPPPPRKVSPWSTTAAIIFGVLGTLSALYTFGTGVEAFMPPGSIYFGSISSPSDYHLQTTFFFVCLGITFLWLLGFVLCLIRTIKTAPQRKAIYQQDLALWQHAMYNWEQLYYCSTCDSVYLQHNRSTTSLSDVYGLIFKV